MLPWYQSPPDDAHAGAALSLESITSRDPALGQFIAYQNWVSDGITEGESLAINRLAHLAGQDSELAGLAAGSPWLADGVTEEEVDLLWNLNRIENPKFATALLRLPWVADGLNTQEKRPALNLAELAQSNPEQYSLVPWATDGMNGIEAEALKELLRLEPQLRGRILGYPWVSDGISYDDKEILYGLASIAYRDPELSGRIASAPWIAGVDRPTSLHWDPLEDIAIVARPDPAVARQVGDLLVARFSKRNRDLVSALRFLVQESPEAFEELTRQPWYSDGINAEEAAFLITTRDIMDNSPSDFYEMLRSRYTRSGTVDLPLTGRVNLWAIQKVPFPPGEDIIADMELAVRSLEELTGAPLPTTDVIALIVVVGPDFVYKEPISNLDAPWPQGAHTGPHIRVSRDLTTTGRVNRNTLFHEIAHYRFRFYPAWLLEGGADFAASFMMDRDGSVSLEDRRHRLERSIESNCPELGVNNIFDLGNVGLAFRGSPHQGCFYLLGEFFLNSMFLSLGEEVASAAIQDIFVNGPFVLGRPMTAKDIFLSFLRNVPPHREAEFLSLFRELHGGPSFRVEYTGPDDHGDEPWEATSVASSSITGGTLDHPFDADYFGFAAESGSSYIVGFHHDVLREDGWPDLWVRLHSPDGGPPTTLAGSRSGIEILWTAPYSGEFRFSVESASGITGSYTVRIDQADPGADDHGNGANNATSVAGPSDAGGTASASGTIDHSSDRDFFRLEAEAGYEYGVRADGQTLNFVRVGLEWTDDTLPLGEIDQSGYGVPFAHLTWRASRSGSYFLFADSPAGSIGSYTLTVERVES